MFFFTDLTRNPENNKKGINKGACENALFIYNLFKFQIEKVTGINFESFSISTEFDQEEFYALNDLECIDENWPKIYDKEPSSESVDYISNLIGKNNKLIISYEISPIFIKIFDLLRIDYLDMRIASVKYLDDLVIGFKTNKKGVFNKLLSYKTPETQFEFEASLLKARNLLVNQSLKQLHTKSAVFAGQTSNDASLIKDSKTLSILDFKKEFEKKTKEFDVIYYKKHPNEKLDSVNYKFVTKFKNVEVIDTNIYHLMSSNQITEFFAISSGSIQEADFFGKKTDYFFNSIYQYVKDGEDRFVKDKYISVYRDCLEINFWADILSPIITTKTINNVQLAPNQNRIRYLHNIYWGYEDLIKNNNKFYRNINNDPKLITELENKIKKIDERRIIKKINRILRKIRIFFTLTKKKDF